MKYVCNFASFRSNHNSYFHLLASAVAERKFIWNVDQRLQIEQSKLVNNRKTVCGEFHWTKFVQDFRYSDRYIKFWFR